MSRRQKKILGRAYLPAFFLLLAAVAIVLVPGRRASSHVEIPSLLTSAPTGVLATRLAQDEVWSLSKFSHAGWKKVQVKSGDTLSAIFTRLHLPAKVWHKILGLEGRTQALLRLHPGDVLKIRLGEWGDFKALRYKLDDQGILQVEHHSVGWNQRVKTTPLQRRKEVDVATVESSLYGSLRNAGLTSAQIAKLNNLLHWDIDLSRSIHAGDTFTVVFNRLYRRGEFVGDGPIEAAMVHTGGRTIRIVRYRDGDGNAGYYHPNGQAVHAALNRAPIHYAYISSGFSLRRLNPVLHVYRPHYGVDYAATRGTPIHAAGDGVITHRGRDGGYGNLITIDHPGPYSTRYAHMSRFKSGLHVGSHVKKGQVIGYVGETGVATGPHLHFEIRVDGVPKNPRTVSLAGYKAISKSKMPEFKKKVGPLLSLLDTSSPVQLARK